MTVKQAILGIPQALRQTWNEGRPLYDTLVRQAPWGDGPVFMTGSGSSYLAALTGAYAFESLMGMPVVVRPAAALNAYTRRALSARSLLIAISASGECEATLQAAHTAKRQGAAVWALTKSPESGLAKLADATVPLYAQEMPSDGVQSAFCQHATTLVLALAATRACKRAGRELEAQEEELAELPRQVEWILSQISDAGRVLAAEIKGLTSLWLIGGGPYHPVALQAARHLLKLTPLHVRGSELTHFDDISGRAVRSGTGVLYVSGSHCRMKAEIHRSVRDIKVGKQARIFAVTDENDREVFERAPVAVLLPSRSEAVGALLALAFLDIVILYAMNPPGAPQPSPLKV